MNTIKEWGAVAGAISAIIALALIITKPFKAVRDRKADEKKETVEFRRRLMEKLDSIEDDIADLQYERLSQAHDYYIERGWCPTSKKQQLCNMYQSYSSKGRNHLSAHYEAEILNLRDEP